jgi:hypothetical protein
LTERFETVVDQFGLRRLYPRSRLFAGYDRAAACAVQPSARHSSYGVEWGEAAPRCCMFATGVIAEGLEGRACSLNGCFCPSQVYKDCKVFQNCTCRTQEKEQR